MSQPPVIEEAEAISSKEIASIPGITGHFQKNQDHVTVFASDEELEAIAEISSVCLNFSTKLADSGFGALNRVSAFTKKSKVVLFALDCQKASPPGVRVFGAKMSASADTDSLIKKIDEVV